MGKSYTAAELVEQAKAKRAKGEKLSAAQERAIRAHEQRERVEIGQAYLRAMPKHAFALMLNRPVGQLQEQHERHGMPCGPGDVDVEKWARWMMDAFGRMVIRGAHRQVAADPDDDPLLVAGMSPNLERYRLAKAIEAERKNALAERELIPAAIVAEAHALIARRFQLFGEALVAQHGPAVARQFELTMAAIQSDVREMLQGKGEPAAAEPVEEPKQEEPPKKRGRPRKARKGK